MNNETTTYNRLPNNLILLQINPDVAANLYGGQYQNWLYERKSSEEPWVPVREMSSVEVMQAEDQRDYDIVLNGDNQTINLVQKESRVKCQNKSSNWWKIMKAALASCIVEIRRKN